MGGRIQHHLAQRLPDPHNLILFIGFQASGTRGAQIKNGDPQVKIFGQIVPVRAQTAALEQFSDHADTLEILKWLHTFKGTPWATWLVHGEPASALALQDAIKSSMHWPVDIGQYLQKVSLR
jgi:metallo-beta-lactamase family protein